MSPSPLSLLQRCLNALTISPSSLRWLFAPRLAALGFSLRTTCASLLALAIAFGMELGQPQWAAMTAWIVAQGTRGESISKGRWRVVGTLAGVVSAMTLVAMTPQQPWLFFPLLAGWVGLCTALGTLVHNFRSYAFVLTAYTCAIVAISSVDAQDQVFSIAVSRGTYILLGVVCEMAVGALFVPDAATGAKRAIQAQLQQIITQAAHVVRDILLRKSPPESSLHEIFSLTLALSDRMEFSAIETGPNEPVVRFASATLGQVTRFASRGVGMRSRLAAAGTIPDGFSTPVLRDTADLLERLPAGLTETDALEKLRQEVRELLSRCQNGVDTTIGPDENRDTGTALRDRVILQGTALLLEELHRLLGCYAGDPAEAGASARFGLVRPPDWRATIANGIRSATAVLIGALIWEVTAWSYGALFVTFVAVICARFASFSNTVLASKNFLYGAVWAVLLSIIPVFLVLPLTADYPVLCLAVGIPMVIGGLATRNPATAALAASFVNFFPYMIGPENHFRTDEIQWFNTSFALLAGLWFGVLIFRHILPFSLPSFLVMFRSRVITALHRIARADSHVDEPIWVGFIVQNMELLIANGSRLASSVMDSLLKGAFSAMTMGRNLMQARLLIKDEGLPASARDVMETMFRTLGPSAASATRLQAIVDKALDELTRIEHASTGLERDRVTMAIGCLMIVSTELGRTNLLLDPRFGQAQAALV
ncbi:FUSC family protein [Acetobacter conturbans]|uniref:FUSC family protein n=1 Tax=Acetobacter conturbans TaxID=1737472 RepID=A0ABX0JUC3_9PROT|nr:FUSC family protein [Acetobacter conturbans]NHN87098.1 FUSC family protein [Acetobacter conturbans]